MLKRFAYTLVLLGFGLPVIAQQHNLVLDRLSHSQYDELLNRVDQDLHTAVKPFFLPEIKAATENDSLDLLFDMPEGFYLPKQIGVNALLDIHAGPDLAADNDVFRYKLGGGVQVHGNVGTKLSFTANYFYQNSLYPQYVHDRIGQTGVIPGFGFADSSGKGYSNHNLSGYLSYSPNKVFNIQVGKGQHFWGDGYRSLFVADNANPYPFMRIQTKVWKVKYVNLFGAYNDITANPADPSTYGWKFMASHFLSWNATKRWNFTLFETVVFQNEDSDRVRGFDVHYLNPIIFYRPIEFSQGSSDNSIIGAGWKWKAGKKLQFYGQLVFDEFLLRTMRADIKQFFNPNDDLEDTGWWANKWGFQAGMKAFDLFKVEDLYFQTEINMVRPYTYSHGAVLQAYGHQNTPLAHPQGANFYEWVTIGRYRMKRWTFEQRIHYGINGEDPGVEANYGGNIFLTYSDRVRTFGNFIGQGVQYKGVFSQSTASYHIKKWGLRVQGGIALRSYKSDFDSQNGAYFFVGIRTPMFNQYVDY